MIKYYRKLMGLIFLCLAGALLVLGVNGEHNGVASQMVSSAVIYEDTEGAILEISSDTQKKAVILYSPEDEWSVKYEKNLRIVLDHMRILYDTLELSRTETISFSEYDLVILASMNWNEMEEPMSRLTDYVEKGGALFAGILPQETQGQFSSLYRKLGIIDYGEYLDYESLSFTEELIPGIRNMEFTEESFQDVGLSVTLEEEVKVYAEAKRGQQTIPVIWSYPCQEGKVVVFNGTGITGDFWRGIAAGCVNALFDTNLYPVLNALCLFIDDFPSPQYESTSDVVRKDYNRSVKEFYRDIWWPDMQKVAQRYGDIYTGLFIATYNNVVDPEEFYYEKSSTEQYFGNSLLRNGNEMGAHGYNHQSLTLEGGTPESMGYVAWADEEDMTASLEELTEITKLMFPGVSFRTYVPPSNYLSPEGRNAVKETIPDLKTISGIYTDEGEEGDVYVQDFVMAEDGIAEFPRITSGMIQNEFDRFSAVSALGLYGVFSHFIHPDDIFDEERGAGQNWESLYNGYCEMMEGIHTKYSFLRSLSASDAAEALMVYDELIPHLEIGENEIRGSVENFRGEAFFYLKTEKNPQTVDESCVVEKIDTQDGSLYYLVTVKEANFKIKLVEP